MRRGDGADSSSLTGIALRNFAKVLELEEN
jgi:hypothetical protein